MAYDGINRGQQVGDENAESHFEAWGKAIPMFQELYHDKIVNILDFGAVSGDDTVDNSTAIEAAFNSVDYFGCHIIIPDGEFYINSDITIPALRNATIEWRGRVKSNGNKIVFQYLRNSDISGILMSNETVDYDNENIVGLEIKGLYKCSFSWREIRGFTTNIWFNPGVHPIPAQSDGNKEPISYNRISAGTLWYSKYNMRVTLGPKSNGGYFNENTFVGVDNRQAGVVPIPNWGIYFEQDPDSWNVNDNRFFGCTFENLDTAIQGDMSFALFSNCRFEQTSTIYEGYLSRSQFIGGVQTMEYDRYKLKGLSRHNTWIGSEDRTGNTEIVFSSNVGGISYFDPITLQKEGHIGYDNLTANFVLDSVGNQSQIMNKQYEQSFNDSDSYYDQIKDGSYREGSFIWNVSPDTRNVLGVIITRSGTHLSGLESLTSKYGQAVTVSGNTGDGFVTLDDPSILDDLQSTVPPFANGCHLDIPGVSSHVEIDTITPDGVISFFSDTVNSDFTGNEVDFYQIRFNQALFELNIIEDSGTQIEFDRKRIYNTPSSPASGSITQNLTDAKLETTQKIYHNDGSLPVPTEWVLIGVGSYQPNTLNIIYAEYVNDNRIEYWVAQ